MSKLIFLCRVTTYGNRSLKTLSKNKNMKDSSTEDKRKAHYFFDHFHLLNL